MAFHVELVTPEQTVVSGEAIFVLARSLDGDVGVMTGHAPMLVGLDIGRLEMHMEDGEVVYAAVHGGFMEVSPESVSILADVTELKDEIDLAQAELARDKVLEELSKDDSEENRRRLRRAEIRIQVAKLA